MANVSDNKAVFMQGVPSPEECKHMKIGIVAAEWNDNVITPLLKGAIDTLLEHGVQEKNIFVTRVPGTIELTYGARTLIEALNPLAVIVLGCVVRGDTPHFDYVCMSVTQGVTMLNANPYAIVGGKAINRPPVIFGVITTDTMQQALDRAGGCVGNKGSESAVTALKMCALKSASLEGKEYKL